MDASRGPQKNLELLIPGLRNYRKLDDIRVADDMLRNQVADKLNSAKANLEGIRKQMATAGDFTNLTNVGSLISQLQQMAGEVRHAEQGYSGWVASVTIDQNRLNQLYNYDYDFVALGVRARYRDLLPQPDLRPREPRVGHGTPRAGGRRDVRLQAEVGSQDGSGKGRTGEAVSLKERLDNG